MTNELLAELLGFVGSGAFATLAVKLLL